MRIKKVLNRFYVHDVEQAIEFYENVLNEKCMLRFKYHQANLEIAQVGNILLISGTDENLELLKATQATFIVDEIMDFKEILLNVGAVVIRDLTEASTGRSMTIKHPDGTIVEYVEQKA